MSATSIHIMHGLPWDDAKIQAAVENVRPNGCISFNLSLENLTVLRTLNERVFKARPDLIFDIYKNSRSAMSEAELNELAQMTHVKKLFLRCANTSLTAIANMQQLNYLRLAPYRQLNLDFMHVLKNLNHVHLAGSFVGLNVLQNCSALEHIFISDQIDSFAFVSTLQKLNSLEIDSCTVTADYRPLNKSSLKHLSLTQIKKMDNVDFLVNFSHLQSLRLHASIIRQLPNLSKLVNLTALKLEYLKAWENPDALQSLTGLQALELEEINPKLMAEQFYFLTKMPCLNSLDYRFIDFGKKRISALNSHFKIVQKEHILIQN